MVANQNSTALSIIESVKNDPMVIETMDRLNEVKAIHQAVFQRCVHYGAPYKGSKNDTLLKPGATFLQQKYGLHEQHERLETTIHVDVNDLSKSYIVIQDRCRIFDSNGQEIAQCDAACTTFEDKYVYRGGGDRVCPTCNEPKIIKSKFDKGWYCLACKAKFAEDDAAIVNQDTAKKLNPNPLNLLDTIVAMAQKRAAVRATIKATGVDALFSPGDGVTVDYYDDMDQGNEDLIAVVAKNASPTNEKATPSDLGASDALEPVAPQNSAEAAKSRFAGNGAPAKGEQKRIGNPPAPSYKTNMGAVKTAVREFYKNDRHMTNSIAKLESDGKLTEDMPVELAIRVITNHKNELEAPF